VSKVSYSDTEVDSTRAYVVLAHAEIEEFCEDIVRSKALKAMNIYTRSSKIVPALRWIITYHLIKNNKSWGEARNPAPEVVNSAYMSYLGKINTNNGVKRKDIEKLLYPLGIQDKHITRLATWLAQMDSFGANRGTLAHKGIGTRRPLDPLTQLQTVEQLLTGLLDLELIIHRRR
jgi:hypothetical protein